MTGVDGSVDEVVELHLSLEEAAALEALWWGPAMPPLLAVEGEPAAEAVEAGLRSLALRGLVAMANGAPAEVSPVIPYVFESLGEWTTRVVVDLAARGTVVSSSWATDGRRATSHLVSEFGVHVLRVGPHADFTTSMSNLGAQLAASNQSPAVDRLSAIGPLAAAQDALMHHDGLDLGIEPAPDVHGYLTVLVEDAGSASEELVELAWLDGQGWLAVGDGEGDTEQVRLSRPFAVPSALRALDAVQG